MQVYVAALRPAATHHASALQVFCSAVAAMRGWVSSSQYARITLTKSLLLRLCFATYLRLTSCSYNHPAESSCTHVILTFTTKTFNMLQNYVCCEPLDARMAQRSCGLQVSRNKTPFHTAFPRCPNEGWAVLDAHWAGTRRPSTARCTWGALWYQLHPPSGRCWSSRFVSSRADSRTSMDVFKAPTSMGSPKAVPVPWHSATKICEGTSWASRMDASWLTFLSVGHLARNRPQRICHDLHDISGTTHDILSTVLTITLQRAQNWGLIKTPWWPTTPRLEKRMQSRRNTTTKTTSSRSPCLLVGTPVSRSVVLEVSSTTCWRIDMLAQWQWHTQTRSSNICQGPGPTWVLGSWPRAKRICWTCTPCAASKEGPCVALYEKTVHRVEREMQLTGVCCDNFVWIQKKQSHTETSTPQNPRILFWTRRGVRGKVWQTLVT